MRSRSPFQSKSPLLSKSPFLQTQSLMQLAEAAGQTKEEYIAANPNYLTPTQTPTQQAIAAADAQAVANGAYMNDGTGPNQPDIYNDEMLATQAGQTGAPDQLVPTANSGGGTTPGGGNAWTQETELNDVELENTDSFQSTNTTFQEDLTVQDLLNTIQTNQVGESGNQILIDSSAGAIQQGIDDDADDGLSSTSQESTPVQTSSSEGNTGSAPDQNSNLPPSYDENSTGLNIGNWEGDGALYDDDWTHPETEEEVEEVDEANIEPTTETTTV